jgi:hypothetical protein
LPCGVRVQVPLWAPYKQLNQIYLLEKFDYKNDYFYFEVIIPRDRKNFIKRVFLSIPKGNKYFKYKKE